MTSELSDIDRRQYIRYPVELLGQYAAQTGNLSGSIKIINVSLGGVAMKVGDHLSEGTIISVFFDVAGKMIKARGKIMWTAKSKSGPFVGVFFEKIYDDGEKRFHDYIATLGKQTKS